MLVFTLVVFLVFAAVANTTSVAMKLSVNDDLPEGERFSWWERNQAAVRRKYQEFHPDSSLPNVDRYATWICISLFIIMVITSIFQR